MKYISLTGLFLLLSVSLFTSCSNEPQAIKYGTDVCNFCRMTISDKNFASEVVSSRGRSFKFDCIECMIRFMKANQLDKTNLSSMLVSDYLNQGKLMDAAKAFYLKSESLSSPMGEGLSAYSSAEQVKQVQQQYSGKEFTWDQLFVTIN
jgi:copper chaperone NosL